jgi:hypothetical protein
VGQGLLVRDAPQLRQPRPSLPDFFLVPLCGGNALPFKNQRRDRDQPGYQPLGTEFKKSVPCRSDLSGLQRVAARLRVRV